MSEFLIAQILMTSAMLIACLSVQFKARQHILLFSLLSCPLSFAHFVIFDQWTAAIIVLLAGARTLVSYFTTATHWMYIFLASVVISAVFTFTGITSILCSLGFGLNTIGAFQSETARMRILMLIASICWLLTDILMQSPAAILSEALFFASTLIGFYRHDLKKFKTDTE